MALFKRNYDKPGPGVPKNAPRKRGFARFAEILGRDFGSLWKLNLLMLGCVAPAVLLYLTALMFLGTPWYILFAVLALVASIPVGPANVAMYFCVSKMLRDDPGFVWHDFKRKFKENFKSAVLPGIFYALIIGVQGYAWLFYMAVPENASLLTLVLLLLSALLFAMVSPYYFLQAGYLELGAFGLFKNSLFLAIGYAPRSFMGVLLGTGLVLLQVVLFPWLLIVTVVLGLTVPCLLHLMWIWPAVDKSFNIEKTLNERKSAEIDEIMDEE